MHAATPQATGGAASILIGDRDSVGNWPLLVKVSGLKPLPKGQWYELYLTTKGKSVGMVRRLRGQGRSAGRRCASSVPYTLKGFDGWVVTTSKQAAHRQVLLTT